MRTSHRVMGGFRADRGGIRIWLLALVVALASLWPASGASADTDIEGLVNCGVSSGRHCDIGGTLQIRTDALGAPRQLVDIDITWVKARIGGLDQDDLVCLSVEQAPAGGLRAIGLVEPCGLDGTVNRGASTGSRLAREGGRRPLDDGDSKSTGVLGGSVSGTVHDLLTGSPLAGVRVTVTGATGPGPSATTDAGGQFLLSDVPPGRATLGFSLAGYAPTSRTVEIVAGQTTVLSVSLVPVAPNPELRFVLTWGARPADLDAHLSGPDTRGGRFHVSFFDLMPVPYASLNRDDQDAFGPEVISVRPPTGTSQLAAGEYRFWVENFSQAPNFSVSNALVTIVQGSRELGTFSVADATGDPNQGIWQVATLTVDASSNVSVTTVQRFQPGDDTTVLTTKPST